MIIYLIAIVILIFLDLITKYWANIKLVNQPIIISDYFQLLLSHNQYIAFSIPVPRWAQLFFSFILLLFLGYYVLQNQPLHKLFNYGSCLIFGGALGNLYERIFKGEVTDFIAFAFWPSFNLADSFITIGALLIIISELQNSNLKKTKNTDTMERN